MLSVINILKQTAADGEGLRNSVYVAGCAHHCKGCHNPHSWDFAAGVPMDITEIYNEIIDPYSNITISGGDPCHPHNISEVIALCKLIKEKHPEKTIWVYTGYTYERLCEAPIYKELFKCIDVLVDGPYIEALRDVSDFKGSTNQRIIRLTENA